MGGFPTNLYKSGFLCGSQGLNSLACEAAGLKKLLVEGTLIIVLKLKEVLTSSSRQPPPTPPRA